LEEPTCLLDSNKQVLVNARGISLCNSPIGERAFEEAYLEQKSNGICSAIKKSTDALVPLSCQSANLAFTYSYQCRFDYWIATNSADVSTRFITNGDTCLREQLSKIEGVDQFSAHDHSLAFPDFIERRVCLKSRDGGLGFTPLQDRFVLLNSLNSTIPQMINRTQSTTRMQTLF
jgi:hypothetical protein